MSLHINNSRLAQRNARSDCCATRGWALTLTCSSLGERDHPAWRGGKRFHRWPRLPGLVTGRGRESFTTAARKSRELPGDARLPGSVEESGGAFKLGARGIAIARAGEHRGPAGAAANCGS